MWHVTMGRILVREARWDDALRVFEQELNRATEANLAGARPAIVGLIASLETTKGDTRRGLELFRDSEMLYRAVGDVDGARMALLGQARNLSDRQ